MKFLFFILLHSCICNFDNPTLSLTILKDKSKQEETHVESKPLKTPLESIKIQKASLSIDCNKIIDPNEDKAPFYFDNPEIIQQIKKLEGLKHLSEVSKKECWLRTELAVFFSETLDEILEQQLKGNLDQDYTISRALKVSDTIKMLLGIPLIDLKHIDKELAKFLVYDIEFESKSL